MLAAGTRADTRDEIVDHVCLRKPARGQLYALGVFPSGSTPAGAAGQRDVGCMTFPVAQAPVSGDWGARRVHGTLLTQHMGDAERALLPVSRAGCLKRRPVIRRMAAFEHLEEHRVGVGPAPG